MTDRAVIIIPVTVDTDVCSGEKEENIACGRTRKRVSAKLCLGTPRSPTSLPRKFSAAFRFPTLPDKPSRLLNP